MGSKLWLLAAAASQYMWRKQAGLVHPDKRMVPGLAWAPPTPTHPPTHLGECEGRDGDVGRVVLNYGGGGAVQVGVLQERREGGGRPCAAGVNCRHAECSTDSLHASAGDTSTCSHPAPDGMQLPVALGTHHIHIALAAREGVGWRGVVRRGADLRHVMLLIRSSLAPPYTPVYTLAPPPHRHQQPPHRIPLDQQLTGTIHTNTTPPLPKRTACSA